MKKFKDTGNEHRSASLNFFIYNTLPGTTSAAGAKAKFLKEIILGEASVEEITPAFAFELLSHMKGGPSIDVLLDLALGDDADIASTSGHLTLIAANTIDLDVNADLRTTSTSTINIQASTGNFVMDATATLNTADGDIRITVGDDVSDHGRVVHDRDSLVHHDQDHS